MNGYSIPLNWFSSQRVYFLRSMHNHPEPVMRVLFPKDGWVNPDLWFSVLSLSEPTRLKRRLIGKRSMISHVLGQAALPRQGNWTNQSLPFVWNNFNKSTEVSLGCILNAYLNFSFLCITSKVQKQWNWHFQIKRWLKATSSSAITVNQCYIRDKVWTAK